MFIDDKTHIIYSRYLMLQTLGSLRYAGSLYVTGINPVKDNENASQKIMSKHLISPIQFFRCSYPLFELS